LEKPDRLNDRRKFLLAAVTVPLTAVAAGSRVLAQQGTALPHLSPTDPQAKALGYVESAKSIDPKSEATYKAGAHCATCAQFTGAAGDAWGPCNIFAGKAVNSNGWCRVWTSKS
jgi:hypothetical protein